MLKRTFVIGDIHGAHKALEQVLERASTTRDDQLIFLGDYVDGWSESPQVIDKLIELKNTHTCVFIRGNHDALLAEWMATQEENEMWLKHGGQSTVAAYQKLPQAKINKHLEFLKSLKNYHIDADNRIFIHAGFSKVSGPQNEYYDYVFYWDRTLWETALATDPSLLPEDPRFPKRLTHFKEIYIGHTPVTPLGVSVPFQAMNVWNIDTGAGFNGRLSLMDIHSKQVFQSDPVYTLYPEENGRN